MIGLYEAQPAKASVEAARHLRRGEPVVYRIKLLTGGDDPARGSYVVRVSVMDPIGTERPEYGRLACTTSGEYEGSFRAAINDPDGEWQIKVAEKLTQLTTSTRVAVVGE